MFTLLCECLWVLSFWIEGEKKGDRLWTFAIIRDRIWSLKLLSVTKTLDMSEVITCVWKTREIFIHDEKEEEFGFLLISIEAKYFIKLADIKQ